MTENSSDKSKMERCYFVDWLRVGAVFLLFSFHSARIFDPWENFYVQNGALSPVLTYIFIWFVSPWHMSLFFLLAGAATYFALRFRTAKQYRIERFKRLFVPFIFGLLVIVPPQSYLGLASHSGQAGSFFDWYPNFFSLNFKDADGYFLGGHTWGHLWFIVHLLIYSLAALPLFMYLKSETGRKWIGRAADFFAKPAVIFLLIPSLIALSQNFPEIAGGNPLFYLIFFIGGFIVMSDARFLEAIGRHRRSLLLFGLIPLAAGIIFYAADPASNGNEGWVVPVTEAYIGGFSSWFLVMAALAYGKRFLNFGSRFLEYFSTGAYPLYILHQTVIIIVGFYAVRQAAPIWGKFLAIVLLSFIVCVGIYDILIKRNDTARFLFGMPPLRRT